MTRQSFPGTFRGVSEPRWLDEREARAWRAYNRMRVQLSAQLNRRLLRDAGLSLADYEVLVNLSDAPDGRLRAFQLGDAVKWEKSRLSHHLTRMQRRGLVRREGCATDGRGAFIALTDDGRAAIERAAPKHVEDVRRAFVDVLTPAQLDALDEISRAVLARLSADDGAGGSDPRVRGGGDRRRR
jgi:DNA-binding MarR family transcriptional regulator